MVNITHNPTINLFCFYAPPMGHSFIMHQSIPAVPIPPPGQPWGICSNVSPGGGTLAILSQPGGWALAWLLIQRSVNNQVLKKIYITVVRF